MGNHTCCVINCNNTFKNSNRKFYRFPTSNFKLEQRKKWIAAVRMKNPDGTPWTPKPNDLICSAHFIGGKKSDVILDPSYIPTIFPDIYKCKKVNELQAASRHMRYTQRRETKEKKNICNSQTTSKSTENMQIDCPEDCDAIAGTSLFEDSESESAHKDQESQATIFINDSKPSTTLICNMYIYNSYCEAQTQTEIIAPNRLATIPSIKKTQSKGCNTNSVSMETQSSQTDFENDLEKEKTFNGFSSVHSDEQMRDLAGVTLDNFNFLLERTAKISECTKVSRENRIFIFLIKMKTGLTFSALSVLFCVHWVTVSRIFFSILNQLAEVTSSLIFWPNKDIVQGTMPECFKPDYSNTRIIIDCTEFRIEVPSSVENKIFCYSNYKKGFTAKVLIEITPGGFISFKSKVAGGRKSDSQITIESGLIDLLEDGDHVLADKGFPEIRSIINERGKKVMVVMPPFLEKKSEFSTDETEETYNIARVRIHVERIMQRLRTYQILSKIPTNLFHCVDNILHVCCVLVNLQPPIIIDKADDEDDEKE